MSNDVSRDAIRLNAMQARNRVLCVLAFVGVFAVVLLTMDRSLYPYDEGVIYVGALRVAEGAIPHRDFYANYGPAQFYLLALLFKLLGPSAIVARLWGCLVKAIIVFVAYGVARRVAGHYASLVGAGLSLVWLCVADMTVWPAWPALLLSLRSAACLMDYLSGKTARLGLAGCLVGLAALFRYDIGALVFIAESMVLSSHSVAKRLPGTTLLSAITHTLKSFIIGAAVVILPLLCWYASAGALPDFIFDVITFPSKHYAATRSLPFPPVPTSVPAWWTAYIVYSPVVIGSLALLMLLGRRHDAVSSAREPVVDCDGTEAPWWPTCLLLMLLLAFFAKGLVRVSVIHMTPAVVLTVLIAITYRRPRGRPLASISITLAALVLVPTTVSALDQLRFMIGRNVDLIEAMQLNAGFGSQSACKSLPCWRRSKYMRLDTMRRAPSILSSRAPCRVRRSSPPLAHPDRTVVNDVMFYFLSDRQPATKWYHFDPGLQTTAKIQQQIINELQVRRPRFVVLNATWEDVREPNASADSSGVYLLDAFLDDSYQTVASFGEIAVRELKP